METRTPSTTIYTFVRQFFVYIYIGECLLHTQSCTHNIRGGATLSLGGAVAPAKKKIYP